MFKTVNGEIYNIESNDLNEILSISNSFFSDDSHCNDLIAVEGYLDKIIYINNQDIEDNSLCEKESALQFEDDLFINARKNNHVLNGGPVPVLDETGNPILLLKLQRDKAYFHQYEAVTDYTDIRVFELYDNVVLIGVTEYGYVLLKDALSKYSGNVICVGDDWNCFMRFIENSGNISVISDIDSLPLGIAQGKTMYITEFLSIMDGSKARCEKGFFSYDEIMTLVYFFSYRISDSKNKQDEKFYLVNPIFPIEGLITICDKIQDPLAYAEVNGYIPIVSITHSNASMYSDYEGEDIWTKFFIQPTGVESNELDKGREVYSYPRAYTSYPNRWLMRRICPLMKNYNLQDNELINERVRKEIDIVRKEVLPDPEHTIGILIRGTDFTVTHLPGHTIMASPEQVMEKINEYMETGDYKYIFLSTEDENILNKMKSFCGDKLRYTNQRRFVIKNNELLSQLEGRRKEEGWLRGVEYLTTLQLLSECKAFISSGICGGTSYVLNNSSEKFEKCYVFDLGRY